MEEGRCIEKVSDGYLRHRCRKKAGLGRDGLYCKTHAKKHPDPNAASRTLYRTDAGYVYTYQIIGETAAKWAYIRNGQGGTILKEEGRDFWTFEEAKAALIAKREEAIKKHEEHLASARLRVEEAKNLTENDVKPGY